MGTKKIIFLMGLPGAGKGTQSVVVAKKYNLLHFETSKLIRDKFSLGLGDPEVAEAKKSYDRGDLISPQLLYRWQLEKINSADIKKGIVFDGSPRTLFEAKNLIPFLVDKFGDKAILVIDIHISVKDTIWRNTHRRVCEACGNPVPFSAETEKLANCQLCQGKLVTRQIDKPEIIEERIIAYNKDTQPAMEYLDREGFLKKVDGQQSIEKVSQAIMKVINNYY